MTPAKFDSLLYSLYYIHLLYFYSYFLFYIHCNKLIFQILYLEVLIVFALITLLQEHSFVSFVVKIILLGLAFLLSAPAADKTKYFSYLSFNSTVWLINGILSDFQKYLNCTAGFSFFRILFATSASVCSNSLVLYLNDLKLLSLVMSALKLVASSLE